MSRRAAVPSAGTITGLRLKNFKAWRDTGQLRLVPLTVLFGTNSSGKSSLHQALLMLRQTSESPDRRRVLHTGDATTPVQATDTKWLDWGAALERHAVEVRFVHERSIREAYETKFGRPAP